MAPWIQDTDSISLSRSDQYFLFASNRNYIKTIVAPLHEYNGATTTVQPRRNRNVSFGAVVTVQHVMSLDDYTPKELEASWFDRKSMRTIKETARFETRLFDSGILFEDRKGNGYKCTVRGLRTREGTTRKRKNRWNALAAVFSEMDAQVEQTEGGCGFYFDDESIADVYFEHTDPCALEAEAIGKQDAVDARNIYNMRSMNP
jgi:hypothetical protein